MRRSSNTKKRYMAPTSLWTIFWPSCWIQTLTYKINSKPFFDSTKYHTYVFYIWNIFECESHLLCGKGLMNITKRIYSETVNTIEVYSNSEKCTSKLW